MAEETQVQETVVTPSPFASNGWSEQLPTPPQQTVETPTAEATPPNTAQTEVPTTVEPPQLTTNEWWKEHGWDDAEKAKTEITELKKLKEAPPTQEYKFENEESKRMAEAISRGDRKTVRQILETQERLEQFTAAEVTDDTAAEIIKLGMQLKYKDLSQKEIEYKFNKEFGLPKEPTQNVDELDEEFASRKASWQEKVDDIKMNRNIEAKLAKPELEKLKSQIVLPEIAKPETPQLANQPTEQELKQIRDNFLQALSSNYNKVEGFTTKVKDESVEIPVMFKIPDEDKVAIKGRLEQGMNVEEYMDKRWFDDKGNPKVEQIISDIYELENRDKVHSGIANDAAAKRLAEYIKSTKNPDINNGNSYQQTFQQPNGQQQNVSPFGRNAWSEKPPVTQN